MAFGALRGILTHNYAASPGTGFATAVSTVANHQMLGNATLFALVRDKLTDTETTDLVSGLATMKLA